MYSQTLCYAAVTFAGIDSISQSRTKSYFTPNLKTSKEARATLDGCCEQLGELMVKQWMRAQVGNSEQVDRWRGEAVEDTGDQ